jgi:tetratricopeptide (TPR) repeat protein
MMHLPRFHARICQGLTLKLEFMLLSEIFTDQKHSYEGYWLDCKEQWQRRNHKARNPMNLKSLEHKWFVLIGTGNYKEAFEIAKHYLQKIKDQLGEKNIAYAKALDQLAVSELRLGHLEKSYNHYEQAMEIREELLGKNHPEIAENLSHMAGVLVKQNQIEKAFDLYINSLNMIENSAKPIQSILDHIVVDILKLYYDLELNELNNSLVPISEKTSIFCQRARAAEKRYPDLASIAYS